MLAAQLLLIMLTMFQPREQVTYAVWGCLDKIELTERSVMSAPIGDNGKPDMSKSQVTHTRVTLKKGCQFTYEVRSK